jgi:hypothetical protein
MIQARFDSNPIDAHGYPVAHDVCTIGTIGWFETNNIKTGHSQLLAPLIESLLYWIEERRAAINQAKL